MRYRTAVKTGRTPAIQAPTAVKGSFGHYVAMVERLVAGEGRPLYRRPSARRSPS